MRMQVTFLRSFRNRILALVLGLPKVRAGSGQGAIRSLTTWVMATAMRDLKLMEQLRVLGFSLLAFGFFVRRQRRNAGLLFLL
jgi:hypothetical protein